MKKLSEFVNLFKQKSGEYVWEWVLKMCDNDGKKIKLDQGEFITKDTLSGDSRFSEKTHIV